MPFCKKSVFYKCKPSGVYPLFIIISTVGNHYSLNRIKNKTVVQGQCGTARWSNKKKVIARKEPVSTTTAMVDTGDVHALMICTAGVGKSSLLYKLKHW